MKNKKKITISKELFIETMESIENQLIHDSKCSDAFGLILNNDFVSGYDNHWILEQLIKVIKIATNDNHKDSWIDYYVWELDWEKKYKDGCATNADGSLIYLRNNTDLWNLLNNMNNYEN